MSDFLDIDYDDTQDQSTLALAPLVQKAKWSPQLVMDIALEAYTEDELRDRYNINPHQLRLLYDNPNFRRELLAARSELTENGGKFRSAAKALAESYLPHMDALMNAPDVAAQTKVTIWQSMVKYAELEPRKQDAPGANAGMTFNVQINV